MEHISAGLFIIYFVNVTTSYSYSLKLRNLKENETIAPIRPVQVTLMYKCFICHEQTEPKE